MVHRVFGATVFGGVTLLANIAAAEITTAQVWSDIEQQIKDAGYLIAATKTVNGDALTISDLQIAQLIPDTTAQLMFDIGTMTLSAVSPNTVSIEIPQTYPIRVIQDDGSDEDFALDLMQYADDLRITATEAADDIAYSYTANTVGVELVSVQSPEFDPTTDSVSGSIEFKNITATAQGHGDASASRDLSISADLLEIKVAAQSSGSEVFDIDLRAGVSGLTYAEKVSLPIGHSQSDMVAALRAGMTMTSAASSDATAFKVTGTSEDGAFTAVFDAGQSDATSSISGETVYVQGNTNGLVLDLAIPDIPIPISGRMDQVSYAFDIPVSAKDTEQSFGIAMSLTGFGMSDAIWSLFDPNAYLSRDPVSASFEILGRGKLGLDVLDETSFLEDPIYGQDLELSSLTIKNMNIAGIGASVSAEGDFTFDNTDLDTYDGAPRPEGEGKVVLSGLNTLMSSLLDMGIIDSEQMFMARMMLGGFMTPTGEDELTSDFEFTPDGGFYANGQRLR
jgi:hypothetical protein